MLLAYVVFDVWVDGLKTCCKWCLQKRNMISRVLIEVTHKLLTHSGAAQAICTGPMVFNDSASAALDSENACNLEDDIWP